MKKKIEKIKDWKLIYLILACAPNKNHQDLEINSSTCRISYSEWNCPMNGSAGKESTCTAGDTRNAGSIPESERSPGGRNGNPLQYFCLDSPMDRGAWWTTAQRVRESDPTERLCTLEYKWKCTINFTFNSLFPSMDMPPSPTVGQLRRGQAYPSDPANH